MQVTIISFSQVTTVAHRICSCQILRTYTQYDKYRTAAV